MEPLETLWYLQAKEQNLELCFGNQLQGQPCGNLCDVWRAGIELEWNLGPGFCVFGSDSFAFQLDLIVVMNY